MNATVQPHELNQPLFIHISKCNAAYQYEEIARMNQVRIGVDHQEIQQQMGKLLDGRSLMYQHRDNRSSMFIVEYSQADTVHINYAQGSSSCPITTHWPVVKGMAHSVGAQYVTARTYNRAVARLARRYGFTIVEKPGYIDLIQEIA